jgi:thiamine transporter ThiT
MTEAGFFKLAVSPSVVSRAVKVALVVGTLLAIINHVDAVLGGTFASKNLVQVILSYLVPYLVSTYSAVHALQQSLKESSRKPNRQ